MKIAITGDNHVQIFRHYAPGSKGLARMVDYISAAGVDAFILLGDMGEGLKTGLVVGGGGFDADYDLLMGTHPNTYYVMGNHDLYRNGSSKATPDAALSAHQRLLYPNTAKSLEATWTDVSTMYQPAGFEDHILVGTFGGCDFLHPGLRHRRAYYAHGDACLVIDWAHIDLRKWNHYTDENNGAFFIRLERALARPGIKHVVIPTHYPCLPTHSHVNPDDAVWPYFYNYRIGQRILELAAQHPDKQFWVFAAHAHEYCRGVWGMEAENVYAFGFKTTYQAQSVMVFDTSMDINTLRGLETVSFG